MAVGDTVVLQSVNNMFDRLSSAKQQRKNDELNYLKIQLAERKLDMTKEASDHAGMLAFKKSELEDRKMTLLEEASALQGKQTNMQIALMKVQDADKMNKVQAASIANEFKASARFLDFYNPDDIDWAENYSKVLKGTYKDGFMADGQGFNFSDQNASLITTSLLQAQAGNPEMVLDLIDKANRASLSLAAGEQLGASDFNLINGLTNMGLFQIGKDESGGVLLNSTREWGDLMESTQNVLSNSSKIRKNRLEIQEGKDTVLESMNFLEYEQLPSVVNAIESIDNGLADSKKFLEYINKKEIDSDSGEVVPGVVEPVDTRGVYEIQKAESDSVLNELTTSMNNLEKNQSTKQFRYNILKNQSRRGYGIDETELSSLDKDLVSLSDTINSIQVQIDSASNESQELSNKALLEKRGIPVNEDNLLMLSKEIGNKIDLRNKYSRYGI